MITFSLAPQEGGRISSLAVDGYELLVTGGPADHPMLWGAYPMLPWAGRVRKGRFSFDDTSYSLPFNLSPHAIHGVGFDRPWRETGPAALEIDLDWPLGGWARHEVTVSADGTSLTATLTVGNDDRPMPAQAGWHPWFRRPLELVRFDAGSMLVRDAEGMPDGARATPPPDGPWDDCFVDVTQPITLSFAAGGGPERVELSSSCAFWVVYSQPEHAVCVEPQTGPPDGFTLGPVHRVEPARPLVATFTITVPAAGPGS